MWQKRSGFTGAFLLWKNDICDDIIYYRWKKQLIVAQ